MERAKAGGGKSYCPFPTGLAVLKSLSDHEQEAELSISFKQSPSPSKTFVEAEGFLRGTCSLVWFGFLVQEEFLFFFLCCRSLHLFCCHRSFVYFRQDLTFCREAWHSGAGCSELSTERVRDYCSFVFSEWCSTMAKPQLSLSLQTKTSMESPGDMCGMDVSKELRCKVSQHPRSHCRSELRQTALIWIWLQTNPITGVFTVREGAYSNCPKNALMLILKINVIKYS